MPNEIENCSKTASGTKTQRKKKTISMNCKSNKNFPQMLILGST